MKQITKVRKAVCAMANELKKAGYSLSDEMQIIETEYLKPCPFCGGKPILRAMDNNSQNGTVTTEIRCGKCHSAGQAAVSFNHSVVVGDERHKGIGNR